MKSWLAALGSVVSFAAYGNAWSTLDMLNGTLAHRLASTAPLLTILLFQALVFQMIAERGRQRRGDPENIDQLPRYSERGVRP